VAISLVLELRPTSRTKFLIFLVCFILPVECRVWCEFFLSFLIIYRILSSILAQFSMRGGTFSYFLTYLGLDDLLTEYFASYLPVFSLNRMAWFNLWVFLPLFVSSRHIPLLFLVHGVLFLRLAIEYIPAH
jgi:hypothetical protein